MSCASVNVKHCNVTSPLQSSDCWLANWSGTVSFRLVERQRHYAAVVSQTAPCGELIATACVTDRRLQHVRRCIYESQPYDELPRSWLKSTLTSRTSIRLLWNILQLETREKKSRNIFDNLPGAHAFNLPCVFDNWHIELMTHSFIHFIQ